MDTSENHPKPSYTLSKLTTGKLKQCEHNEQQQEAQALQCFRSLIKRPAKPAHPITE